MQKSLISSLSGMLGHADFRIDEERIFGAIHWTSHNSSINCHLLRRKI